jgi:hypothetical protein
LQAQEKTEDAQETTEDSKLVDVIDSPSFSILSLPARSEADEIAAMILAQVLETKSCVVQALSVSSLASEMIDLVEQRKAEAVCISATPPGAMMHARYLCRQLRRRFPKVKLIVGLWDFSGDLSKVSERIGNGAIVVATLTGAQEKVRLLIQESLLQIEPQVSPESGPVIVQRSHPSHVEVRSTLQRALPANAIDVGTKSNCGQAAARGESPAS